MQSVFEQLHQILDTYVEKGSDDELFASGYLRGFIDLAISQEPETRDALIGEVDLGLSKAIENGELGEEDQMLVKQVWHKIYTSIV